MQREITTTEGLVQREITTTAAVNQVRFSILSTVVLLILADENNDSDGYDDYVMSDDVTDDDGSGDENKEEGGYDDDFIDVGVPGDEEVDLSNVSAQGDSKAYRKMQKFLKKRLDIYSKYPFIRGT